MKFLIKLLLTIAIVFASEAITFFWLPAFLILSLNFLYRSSALTSILSGGLGMGLTWGIMSWLISTGEGTLIHSKISGVFSLTETEMMLVPGLIAFLIGVISAYAGYSVGKFSQKKSSNIYKA